MENKGRNNVWAISVRPTDTLPHSNDVLTHCGLPNERLQEELGGYKQLMWGTKPKKKRDLVQLVPISPLVR